MAEEGSFSTPLMIEWFKKQLSVVRVLQLPKIVMFPGLCNVLATAVTQDNEFMQVSLEFLELCSRSNM